MLVKDRRFENQDPFLCPLLWYPLVDVIASLSRNLKIVYAARGSCAAV